MVRGDVGCLSSEFPFYEQYLQSWMYKRDSITESCHIHPKRLGEESEGMDRVNVMKFVSCGVFLGSKGVRALTD